MHFSDDPASVKSRALEILYRVWVSYGTLNHDEARFLAKHCDVDERPVATCLRLAGYPDDAARPVAAIARLRSKADRVPALPRRDAFGRSLSPEFKYLPPPAF